MRIVIVLSILWAICGVECYKFLAVFNLQSKSHNHLTTSIMKGLARAGHDVTVLSPIPPKQPIPNYHHITVPMQRLFGKDDKTSPLLNEIGANPFLHIMRVHNLGLLSTENFLNASIVKEFIQINQTFDAVFFEMFSNEALIGFSEHYNAPLIVIGTFGAMTWNTDMVGTPSPPSYVPSPLLSFTDHMNLWERMQNFMYLLCERVFLDMYYLPKQASLYTKYFPTANRSMLEVRKNTALVLVNQHVSWSFPRPYLPNMIEVGGIQINSVRNTLPLDIQKFIDESTHGVIYFSFGTSVKGSHLPPDKIAIFLNTFKALPQRVLWKYENPNLVGKPENVLIRDWFPQEDILAHAKVIVYITHGGLLSITESIYFGKPIVGIPLFADQFLNVARAVRNGYGLQLDYMKLNKETLSEAIHHVLSNKSYTQVAHHQSKLYEDQDMSAMQRAIYWIEYIARHKGAHYLHCAGQDLNIIQYHNIDVIFIICCFIILIIIAIMKIKKNFNSLY